MKLAARLSLSILALAPIMASAASASTISCANDSLALTIEAQSEQISSVKVVKSNDGTLTRDLNEGGSKGLSGPSISSDPTLPRLYEGDFKSPSPQGLGSYTLSFSADNSKAELDYDNDDGDMRVINLRCSL